MKMQMIKKAVNMPGFNVQKPAAAALPKSIMTPKPPVAAMKPPGLMGKPAAQVMGAIKSRKPTY